MTGIVTYTPDPNFNGTDTFDYMVCDDGNPLPFMCDTATVTIIINPVNDPPVAMDDDVTTSAGIPSGDPVIIDVVANDEDPIDPLGNIDPTTVDTIPGAGPMNGSVTINPVTGEITYTPDGNFGGIDMFEYVVCDDGNPLPALCDTATVTVTVNSLPITAVNDTVTTPAGMQINIPVLNNDIPGSVNLDPASVDTITGGGPLNGMVSFNVGGSIDYIPNPTFTGLDSFMYLVCDSIQPIPNCDTAIVFIDVLPMPDAVNDINNLLVNFTVNGNILTNDDGQGLPITLNTTPVEGPNHGSIMISPDGSYVYSPEMDYVGEDTVSYVICNNVMLCDTAYLFLEIVGPSPQNDPPVANEDVAQTFIDIAVSGNILNNDVEPDGDNIILNVVPILPVMNGSLALAANGMFTYTPNMGFEGTDTFCYVICDDGIPSLCDTACVVIDVMTDMNGLANDPPFAQDDAISTQVDLIVAGDVSPNDFDPNGNPLIYETTPVLDPAFGMVMLNADGSYTYTPAPGHFGADRFVYAVCDTFGLCDTATVYLTVIPPSPEANDDINNTLVNIPVNGNLLTNDDDEGLAATLSGSPFDGPENGTIVLNPDGSYTYTPNPDFFGEDTVCYTICNAALLCDTAYLYLEVIQPGVENMPPVANEDVGQTLENVALIGNILNNDFDPDGDNIILNITPLVGPVNGMVLISNDGMYTYTPNMGFMGLDTFCYVICDDVIPDLCDTACVFIEIMPDLNGTANDSPFAQDDAISTHLDIIVSGDVSPNDFDPNGNQLVFGTAPVVGAGNGTVILNADGTYLYTPDTGYFGPDQFVYSVCDTFGLCDTATVYLTVIPHAPNALDDINNTVSDISVIGNVLTNDDEYGLPFVLNTTPVDGPDEGTISINADGSYEYIPGPGYAGEDSISYEVCNPADLCDTAYLYITVIDVTGDNSPPVANEDVTQTFMDVTVSGNVLNNDFDPDEVDGDSLILNTTLIVDPSNGSVQLNPDGSFVYTPSIGSIGMDTFCYVVCDEGMPSLCDTACVVVDVLIDVNVTENDPPFAQDDAYGTDVNTPVNGDMNPNDFDPNGDLLTYGQTPVDGSSNGMVTINLDGTFVYTPTDGYYGPDHFTYSVCDESALCDTATVYVTMLGFVDLALTSEVATDQIDPGEEMDVIITVYNQSPVIMDSIIVVHYIPDGFELNDSDWVSTAPLDISFAAEPCENTAYSFLTRNNGILPAGGLGIDQSATIEITLNVLNTTVPGGYVHESEIFKVFDTNGNEVTDDDIDSTPDDDCTNDAGGQPESAADDFIDGDGTGVPGDGVAATDEDDHDPAVACVVPRPMILGPAYVCPGDIQQYEIASFNPENGYIWSLSSGGTIVENVDSAIIVQWQSTAGGPFIIRLSVSTNFSDCEGSTELPVFVQGVDPLACNDHVNISLDSSCELRVLSGLLLEGELEGNDLYFVELFDELDNPIPNATLTSEHIGQVGTFTVINSCFPEQSCWGTILVEDKIAPEIICPCPVDSAGQSEACQINCNEAVSIADGNVQASLRPIATDGCSEPILEILNTSSNFDDCEGGNIEITWIATDGSGNTATCSQVFIIVPFDIENVEFPDTYESGCGGDINPDLTGYPLIDGFEIDEQNCNLFSAYWDEAISDCGGGFKILRTWTVVDWCTREVVEGQQVIKLTDDEGPEMTCPADIEIGTDFWNCSASLSIPLPVVVDACGSYFELTLISHAGVISSIGDHYVIYDLPVGEHTITWIATDECDNSSSCNFEITVIDDVPPVPNCDEHTIVSLTEDGINGTTLVSADVFDDGSFDNCGEVTFEARRMNTCIDYDWTTNGACIDDIPNGHYSTLADGGLAFKPCVPFACCDLGQGPIMVELKVTDASGNENFCMVEVEVQDKLAPFIECPPNVIVSCDFWFDSDVVTGQRIPLSQDPMTSVFGTVKSDFDLIDDQSIMSARQPIIINDPGRPTNSNDPGYLLQPHIWGIDGWAEDNCDLTLDVRISIQDDCSSDNLPSGAPDHAVRYIERRFTATDGDNNNDNCRQFIWVVDFDPFYISDETCVDLDRNDGVKWPCDILFDTCPDSISVVEPIVYDDNCGLIGVTYSDTRFDFVDGACYKILREWKVIDWCQYDVSTGEGLWTYTQVIKVIDSNGPEFIAIPGSDDREGCPIEPITLCLTDMNSGFELSLPDHNQVFVGEGEPNASSCSAHVTGNHVVEEFCSEYVIYDVKVYPFNGSDFVQVVGKTQVRTDESGQAILNFNTRNSVIPSIAEGGLPYNSPYCQSEEDGGYHRLLWSVEDGCGNINTCEYLIRLEDCKQPSPVCINGISTVVMPNGGAVSVWAQEFNASSIDDCTPSENLLYSFSGDTYQPSMEYNCDNVPAFGAELSVQVWVADGGVDHNCSGTIDWAERNKDFCTTTVVITDNDGVCGTGNVISGEVLMHSDLKPVEMTTINLTHPTHAFPSVVTSDDGKYQFMNIPAEGPFTITPMRNDNHKNGVSTLDLVRIQKHILGIDPFKTAYQYIAADANNSEDISALDLVAIRKLILGVFTEFPRNTSWRFVDREFDFFDIDRPWPFNEFIMLENLELLNLNEDFMAVKVGDLDNTVVANLSSGQVVNRGGRDEVRVTASTKTSSVEKGELLEVEMTIPSAMIGFQWTLDLEGLNYIGIESGFMGDENVGVHKGQITMSFAHAEIAGPARNAKAGGFIPASTTFKLLFEATQAGRTSDKIRVTSDITEAEGYLQVPAALVAERAIKIVNIDLDFVIPSEREEYALYQNEPNPFRDYTTIGFELPRSMSASISIYDLTGKVVKVIEGDYPAGYNTVRLNSKDLLSGGVYYYHLSAGEFTASKKFVLTK
jgi:hypothetical protein